MILPDAKSDSAVVLFPPGELELPKQLIELRPTGTPINIGIEVGWLGYPALEPYTVCFFSGTISARREDRSAYLIDGVAINGVSGGPVLYSSLSAMQVVGIISAYRVNRQRGDALPGLSVAQDVSHFHQVIQQIKSWDEAQKKRAQIEAQIEAEKKKAEVSATTDPPASTLLES